MKNNCLKYFNKNKIKQPSGTPLQTPLQTPSETNKQKPVQQYTSLIDFRKALNWLKSEVLKTIQSKRKIEYLEQIQEIKMMMIEKT